MFSLLLSDIKICQYEKGNYLSVKIQHFKWRSCGIDGIQYFHILYFTFWFVFVDFIGLEFLQVAIDEWSDLGWNTSWNLKLIYYKTYNFA